MATCGKPVSRAMAAAVSEGEVNAFTCPPPLASHRYSLSVKVEASGTDTNKEPHGAMTRPISPSAEYRRRNALDCGSISRRRRCDPRKEAAPHRLGRSGRRRVMFRRFAVDPHDIGGRRARRETAFGTSEVQHAGPCRKTFQKLIIGPTKQSSDLGRLEREKAPRLAVSLDTNGFDHLTCKCGRWPPTKNVARQYLRPSRELPTRRELSPNLAVATCVPIPWRRQPRTTKNSVMSHMASLPETSEPFCTKANPAHLPSTRTRNGRRCGSDQSSARHG